MTNPIVIDLIVMDHNPVFLWGNVAWRIVWPTRLR